MTTGPLRLRRARLLRLSLPLVRPLATAHGSIPRREGWLVELEDEAGQRAFGEATPLPAFGTEDGAASRRTLEARLATAMRDGVRVEALSEAPPAVASPTPSADFAWSTACLDLAGQRAATGLAELFGRAVGAEAPPAETVRSQALVGGTTPEDVARSAQEARAAGFAAFKLKLGVSPETPALAVDLDRVAALREIVGAGARVRLDANEAWDEGGAARALAALARFDVDFVEQPLARHDVDGLARLAARGEIAVAADEALLDGGWRACLDARAISIWVVKPAALGALPISLELARRVRERGGRIVWSTLIDGAIGRGVARALAAGTGAAGEVHGLGTGPLLATDVLDGGDPVVGGRSSVPRSPGLGVAPSETFLASADVVCEVHT